LRHIVPCLSLILLLASTTPPAASADPAVPNQRDWMINLVDGMGWSFGLPDQPQDADYQRILDGERLLRVEAETAKQPTDMVSVKEYTTFGPFSGTGWVSGIATPTSAHLRFLLPWSGTYEVTAALRLAGHRISIDGTTFAADGEENFSTVQLGEIELSAGEHEALVEIPANASIDFIELRAPPLPPIQPLAGWQPDRPLSLDDMAVTAVRTLGLEPLLPLGDEIVRFEAEIAGHPEAGEVTDVRHLGEPSGGKWIRAGAAGAELRIDFTADANAAYLLSLRGAAGTPVEGAIDERQRFGVAFPPYLETLAVGTFFLEQGVHSLALRLPPRAGLDLLLLRRRESSGSDYRWLIGLPPGEVQPPSPAQIDQLLSLLAAIGPAR